MAEPIITAAAAYTADQWTKWGAVATAAAAVIALAVGLIPLLVSCFTNRAMVKSLGVIFSSELEDALLKAKAVEIFCDKYCANKLEEHHAQNCQEYLILCDLPMLRSAIADLPKFPNDVARALACAISDINQVHQALAPGGVRTSSFAGSSITAADFLNNAQAMRKSIQRALLLTAKIAGVPNHIVHINAAAISVAKKIYATKAFNEVAFFGPGAQSAR